MPSKTPVPGAHCANHFSLNFLAVFANAAGWPEHGLSAEDEMLWSCAYAIGANDLLRGDWLNRRLLSSFGRSPAKGPLQEMSLSLWTAQEQILSGLGMPGARGLPPAGAKIVEMAYKSHGKFWIGAAIPFCKGQKAAMDEFDARLADLLSGPFKKSGPKPFAWVGQAAASPAWPLLAQSAFG